MYVAIKRLSNNRALSVFLYLALGFYFIGFNQVRQSIALSLTVLAYSYMKRSKISYVLLMALAVSFHVSAVVVPVVHLATARWKPTATRMLLLTIVVGVVGYGLTSLTSFASAFNDRYGEYLEAAEVAGVGTLILAGVRLVVVVWGFLANSRVELTRDAQRFILYVAVSVGLVLLGYVSIPVARLEMYFSAYMIFLIPAIVSRSQMRRALTWAVVAVGLIHMLIHVSTFNSVLPYQTIDGFVSGAL